MMYAGEKVLAQESEWMMALSQRGGSLMSKETLSRTLSGTVGDIAFTGIFDDLYGKRRIGYNPNMHNWFEIDIVYEGDCYIEGLSGQCVGPLTRGDFVLISPGYYHQEKKTNDTELLLYKVRFEVSHVAAPSVAEKLYAMLYQELQSLGHGIFRFRLPNAIHYFDEISRCLGDGETGSFANAEATFKMFMTEFFMEIMHLKRSDLPADGEVVNNRKKMIESYLEANYSNSKLTAEMLAKHMHLSVRQMNRIVTGFYGVTFYHLLTEIRLEHAKKLLLTSAMTVKEIAALVGYDSSTGFFVAFKKKFGITPGEFCKAHQEQ